MEHTPRRATFFTEVGLRKNGITKHKEELCDEGKVAIGKRRVKCRWTRKKGFFWKTVSSGTLNLTSHNPSTVHPL